MKYYILFLLMISEAAAVSINEIMYNPIGDDNTFEFVEIFGENNLSNYTIGDLAANDTLTLVKYWNSSFSLIVEDGFNHTGINASIYSAGGNIGNGLGNSQDTIFLYFNGTVVDQTSYDGTLANNNGFSLEYDNGWRESYVINGTPGRENSQPAVNETNATINETNETIPVNNTNTTNLTNANVTNETINQTNECSESIELLITNFKEIYDSGDTITFRNIPSVNPPYTIRYSVLDVFNNLVREATTANSNTKQFTPKLTESDRAFIIRSELVGSCGNATEKIVLFRGQANACSEEVVCESQLDEISKLSSKTTSSGGGGSCSFQISIIESFYTRKKKFAPEITLYTKIKLGEYTLNLYSTLENQSRAVNLKKSETLEFNVSASHGRNLFVLEVVENDKVMDVAKLLVQFEELEKESKEIIEKVETKQEKKEKETDVEKEPKAENKITGHVVYQQDTKFPFWIAGVGFVAVLGISLWRKFGDKNDNNIYKSLYDKDEAKRNNTIRD